MDYVREELLRQKRALEALMLGAAEEERAGEESLPPVEDRPEDGATERLRSPSAVKGSGRAVRLSKTEAAERSLRRGAEWFAQEAAVERLPAAEGGASAVVMRSDARRLSRTIQRDARRYDGGFTIY